MHTLMHVASVLFFVMCGASALAIIAGTLRANAPAIRRALGL